MNSSQNPKYRKFLQNKLVRDKVMERLKPYGSNFDWKYLNDQEFEEQLKLKLIEEAAEVCCAKSKDLVVEELADVLEVMIIWAELIGSSLDDVIKQQQKKRETHGGFCDRKFLITASHVDESPCANYCLNDPEKYPEIIDK